MQSWFVLPQDREISTEAAESYLVRQHLTDHPDGGVRLRTAVAPGGRHSYRKDPDGWVCATAAGDDVGPATAPLDDDGLLQELTLFRSGQAVSGGSRSSRRRSALTRPWYFGTGMDSTIHAYTRDEWGIGGSQPYGNYSVTQSPDSSP